MSKKDKDLGEVKAEVVVEDKEVALPIPAAPVKRFTFDQWAANRNIPVSYQGGLRAYCKNISKLRTFAEWDSAFKNY